MLLLPIAGAASLARSVHAVEGEDTALNLVNRCLQDEL